MIRSFLAYLALLAASCLAMKAPGPSAPAGAAAASCTSTADAGALFPSPFPAAFGVSRRVPAVLTLRGGAVLEPESLQDVEAILLRAGSEGKLVVIDFSATWYVRVLDVGTSWLWAHALG